MPNFVIRHAKENIPCPGPNKKAAKNYNSNQTEIIYLDRQWITNRMSLKGNNNGQ